MWAMRPSAQIHKTQMLTHLHIRNFKAWRDTQPIRLAPLTVFFGSNSSGKSSINQFLLMLKQTVQSPDRRMILHLGDKTTVIDLGTFGDIVHTHKTNERLDFEFGWTLPREMDVRDRLSNRFFSGKFLKFTAQLGLPGGNRQDLVVHHMSYQIGEPSKKTGLKVGMKRETKKDRYSLTAYPYQLVSKLSVPLPHPTHFYGFPSEVTAKYENADFVSELTLALEKRLQDIYYLGALREAPQRTYIWSGEIPEFVGWRGERAVDAILAARARDQRIRSSKTNKIQSFDEMVAYWLKEMGLIESFEIKQVAPNRRDYEVLVKTVGIKDQMNLTDVGFGVSQVLPVLVQCFYAPQGSTIILEQPEVHLHPSAQAVLADVFIDAINAQNQRGKRHNIQLLIESHSEHFLRRLQRRIAEDTKKKNISPSNTAIYVCEATSSGSILKPLNVDDYGNIKNWPNKFFGDEVGDLMAMTEAAIQRQMK